MSWSLFEHTHPRNIFVFGRDGVEYTPYNTYVIIANDYAMAKRILENICGYFAPWIENGTLYTRMCTSWNLQILAEKNRGEHIIVQYDKADVEHISYWFKIDFDELDQYWRNYLGLE